MTAKARTRKKPPARPKPATSTTGVLAATLSNGDATMSFADSRDRLIVWDATHDGALVRGGGPITLPASPNSIAAMRNRACAMLLDEPEFEGADWLLFIDSDMGFAPDALDQLLAVADPVERPVVGALCFGLQQRETDEMGGYICHPFPTIYDWRANEAGDEGFVIRWDYPVDTVTRVAATGAAFLLIHRDVLAKMRVEHEDTWFDRARMAGGAKLLGEDMSFFARLGRMGVAAHVHTGVKTTHRKPLWVNEDYYREAWARARLSDWLGTDEGQQTLVRFGLAAPVDPPADAPVETL